LVNTFGFATVAVTVARCTAFDANKLLWRSDLNNAKTDAADIAITADCD